jgi:hypothetical protein
MAVRKSTSMAARAVTAACMSGSKNRKVLRPAALAWYIAVSARFINSSMVTGGSRNSVMPKLEVQSWLCWFS